MAKMNVKKGDNVMVIAGKDKGNAGKVLKVLPEENRVYVEGINIVSKSKKPRNAQDKGGILKQEAAIDASNVMHICPACGEVVRVRHGKEENANGEMKFTVFVNEFYYDTNPMNPNDHDILWKRFVNQPNRLMHILCDSQKSLDEASSATGSVITIRQKSIQTPYNTNNDNLMTAWGCETIDERRLKVPVRLL